MSLNDEMDKTCAEIIARARRCEREGMKQIAKCFGKQHRRQRFQKPSTVNLPSTKEARTVNSENKKRRKR